MYMNQYVYISMLLGNQTHTFIYHPTSSHFGFVYIYTDEEKIPGRSKSFQVLNS